MANETITTFKGFDQNLQCRDFQYAVGETYEHKGDVEACRSGFHACEHPLDIFQYYSPATSRFARVTQSGNLQRHSDDSKVASARITIEAELKLYDIVQAAVDWVFSRAKWSDGSVATKANEGVTASGYSGAATASGPRGAATASGLRGAATASGYSGAATATGWGGKVRGAKGCALFLVERNDNLEIISTWSGIVGKTKGIEADTWYTLKSGKPVVAKD